MDFIRAFHLPSDEESFIVEREINHMSIAGIARKYNTSIECVRNRRRTGFSRIADAIEYEKERDRG